METKEITLAGVKYKLPEMAIRQRRVITPLWLAVLAHGSGENKKRNDAAEKGEKYLPNYPTEIWDNMIEMVYQAVNKATGNMTRDQVLDMNITFFELMEACPVIAQLSGFDAVGDDAPGEPAGEQPSPATGANTST